MYVRMCIYYIYDIYFGKMFALLYLIFRRCAWMQYMKMGHSGTAGQGTLSPCALKGQIFSSQGHPYPSECDGTSRHELRQFTLAV